MSTELFAKTAKEASAERTDDKKRIWRLIKTHDPEAAAFLTEWQRQAKEAGEVGVAAVGFGGEWSDGRPDESAEDERRAKHMSKYLSARK